MARKGNMGDWVKIRWDGTLVARWYLSASRQPPGDQNTRRARAVRLRVCAVTWWGIAGHPATGS